MVFISDKREGYRSLMGRTLRVVGNQRFMIAGFLRDVHAWVRYDSFELRGLTLAKTTRTGMTHVGKK